MTRTTFELLILAAAGLLLYQIAWPIISFVMWPVLS